MAQRGEIGRAEQNLIEYIYMQTIYTYIFKKEDIFQTACL